MAKTKLEIAMPTEEDVAANAGEATPNPNAHAYKKLYAHNAIVPGNIDLENRPWVKNPDGSTSTVYSSNAEYGGHHMLVPGVNDTGYVMDNDQTDNEYYRTHKHMGEYANDADAAAAGQAIHLEQMAHQPADTLSGRGGPGYDMTPPVPPASAMTAAMAELKKKKPE